MRKRHLAISVISGLFFLMVVLCSCPYFETSAAGAIGINVKTPSQYEIKQRLSLIQDLTTQYETQPLLEAPYSAGSLTSETLQNALDWVNAIRFVAGIPDNVTLNSDYNAYAQASSIVNFANDVLSHYPSQPSGMSEDLYNAGNQGSQKSNIACGWGTGSVYSYGVSSGSIILHSWMADEDPSNISRVGHRRWILNPSMQQTGFGCVWGADANWGSKYYSAIYAMDNSFGDTEYYGVTWPAQNMPVSFFRNDYPWSVSMGRDVGSNTTVKLTRLSDGAVWNFASGSSDYYINNDYYGQKGCIIFRPSGISSYNHGDAFEVEISGSGIEVKYTVNFFDPDKISGDNPVQTPTPTPELTMAPTPTPELTNVPTPTTNPASGIDFSDISFSFTDIRSNGYITFNGSDGTAKVLILGGVGTCSNTCSFIKSLSSFVPQMMENVEIFVLDVKNNSDSSMIQWLSESGIDSKVHCSSINSVSDYSLYYTILDRIGIFGSWTMPAAVYIDKNGMGAASSTGYVTTSEIQTSLLKIVSLNQDVTRTPSPTAFDFSSINFSFTDVRTKESRIYDGKDGKAKVLILGGIGSSTATQWVIEDISDLVERFDEEVDIVAVDISENSENDILTLLNRKDISEKIHCAQGDSVSGGYFSLFFNVADKAGISYITYPLVLYIDKNGYSVEITTGERTPESIEAYLSKIVKINPKQSVTVTPIATLTPVPTITPSPVENTPTPSMPTPIVTTTPTATPALTSKPTSTPTPTSKPTSTPTPTNVPSGSDSTYTSKEKRTETETRNGTTVTKVYEKNSSAKAVITVTTKTSAGKEEVLQYTVTGDNSLSLTSVKTNLTKLTIPDSVEIGNITYYVQQIGSSVVKSGKKKLKEITIGSNVSTIKKKAFYGLTKVKVVNLSASNIKSIGKSAFKKLNKKTVFNISGNKKQFSALKSKIASAGAAKTVKYVKVS